ncbi:hypothetical protein ACFVUS_27795 [Nocardia sp. NPDC058058]|uniref:hypothetical protein n=1 Tax=Nocardia sp. NPDC058058 TaxID=3346317 RepID=UPI0036DA8FFB
MTVTLNPSIIGQAEKVHTAILAVALANTGLDESQWITLNQSIAIDPGDTATLRTHVVTATKRTHTEIDTAITRLNERDLLDGAKPTAAGRTLVADVRAGIAPALDRAYGQVSLKDSAIAAQALITVTAALSQELSKLTV